MFDFTKIKKIHSVKDNDKRMRINYILGEIQKTHWTKDFIQNIKRNSKNSRIRKQETIKKNRPKTPTDIKEYKQMSNKHIKKKLHVTCYQKCEFETAMTTLCTNQNGQTQNTNNKM